MARRIPNDPEVVENIQLALSLLPPAIHQLFEDGFIHIFVGDPVFAGIGDGGLLANGWDPREAPHTMYPWHSKEKDAPVTLVFPKREWAQWDHIVHEFGHAVHLFGCDLDDAELVPCTEYAKTDHYECFAEAFVAFTSLPHAPRYGEMYEGLHNLTLDDINFLEFVCSK